MESSLSKSVFLTMYLFYNFGIDTVPEDTIFQNEESTFCKLSFAMKRTAMSLRFLEEKK
jgi:hypothetical protein